MLIKKKCAVILRGNLRTYKETAKSLKSNILEPNDADLFICTYRNEGKSRIPSSFKNDVINITKFKQTETYINQDKEGKTVNCCELHKLYGRSLKDVTFVDFDSNKHDRIKIIANKISSVGLDKERTLLSYNTTVQALKFFLEYCLRYKVDYDYVILSRPDLLYYTKLDVSQLDPNIIYVPSYGGNIKMFGNNDAYYVASYKNVERLEYIPFNSVIFNDQLIISSKENICSLLNLFEKIKEYELRGIPTGHPETLFYYHMAFTRKRKVILLKNFFYEILRSNFMNSMNGFYQFDKEDIDNKIENLNKKFQKHKRLFFWPFCVVAKVLKWPLEIFIAIYYYKKMVTIQNRHRGTDN